jgi:hypothetical protein
MNRRHLPFPVEIERLPKHLQQTFIKLYSTDHPENSDMHFLETNNIYCGDARQLLPHIEPNSIALSVWSPPYFVGKEYEEHLSFDEWKDLLQYCDTFTLPNYQARWFSGHQHCRYTGV